MTVSEETASSGRLLSRCRLLHIKLYSVLHILLKILKEELVIVKMIRSLRQNIENRGILRGGHFRDLENSALLIDIAAA